MHVVAIRSLLLSLFVRIIFISIYWPLEHVFIQKPLLLYSCVLMKITISLKKIEKTYRIDLLKSHSMLQHKISKSFRRVFSFSY